MWTGGDIISKDGKTWDTECSSSILSSCQVKCDKGWGGGGQYVCNYNNSAAKVCKHINDSVSNTASPSKHKVCESYVGCEYNEKDKKCTAIPSNNGIEFKGQTEWVGPPCYELNNDSFAHGIYNYPLLNTIFPPLERLIVFFIIIIIISFILYKLDAFKYILIGIKNILVGEMGFSKSMFSKVEKGTDLGNKTFKDGLIFKTFGSMILYIVQLFWTVFKPLTVPWNFIINSKNNMERRKVLLNETTWVVLLSIIIFFFIKFNGVGEVKDIIGKGIDLIGRFYNWVIGIDQDDVEDDTKLTKENRIYILIAIAVIIVIPIVIWRSKVWLRKDRIDV